MADGVSFQTTAVATPPDATKVATDDAGASGHVQIVKLAQSADGSATPVTADVDGMLVNLGANNDVTVASLPLPSGAATAAKQDTLIGHVDGIEGLLTTIDADTGVVAGQVGANGLKVDLGADNDVTVTGSVTANAGTNLNTSALALEAGGNLATAVASLSVIDDWDETDRAKVNPIAGQAGVAGGTGVDAANVQRVSLATNVALPAGTNAIGKLAANSGVDIGDVDVTSVAGTATNASAHVTVTNASTTIIAARTGRRGVLLINYQTVAVFVDPSGGTAATTHARLDPGASLFLPVTSAITGITSAAYTASGDAKVHYFEAY
jgi:hypothetical protein